jgi:hypothetical protein
MRITERARQGWNDLEGRMRHGWRIYATSSSAGVRQTRVQSSAMSSEQGCEPTRINPGDWLEMMARADIAPEGETPVSPTPEERKPIVSIHGQDVDENELEDTRKEKAA